MKSYGKSIRLVAIDVDGTFLDGEGKYDRVRFTRIHFRMQDDGIHFVIVSGDQHRTLSRCFDHHPGIFHIAENGALVAASSEVLYTIPLVPADLDTALSLSVELPGVFVLVCCASAAYAPRTSNPDVITALGRYYANLELADDQGRVEEPVLKLALGRPGEKTAGLLGRLKASLSAGTIPTSSGRGSINIIPADMNKGVTLAWLGEWIDVSLDDVVAFGGGGNDVEVLERTGTGIAMNNTPETVKEVSSGMTEGNNSQGVFAWLEDHLGLAN